MYNPFDGTQPGWGPFGRVLQGPISILLGVVWGAAILYAAYHLIVAIAQLAGARREHRASDAEAAAGRIVWPVVAIIVLFALPAIWTVLVSVK